MGKKFNGKTTPDLKKEYISAPFIQVLTKFENPTDIQVLDNYRKMESQLEECLMQQIQDTELTESGMTQMSKTFNNHKTLTTLQQLEMVSNQ